MAELFLARQVGVMGFERILAIKRILPHLTNNKEFVEMFINEAKLAAQITHPHVVQIYDFGVVEGAYFITMEFIMGKNLAEILLKGKKAKVPIPGGLAIYITSKIAAGLDYAFQGITSGGKPLGIVHRDISPQNVLIGYNGDVKLVDFGIAKAASSNHHTQTGTLKGKLAYFSPEQAWGKQVDQRSDIFSLAIVLHEMLTETRLFKGENEIDTIEKIRKTEIPPPSSLKPFLPKAIDAILLKALARNPEERFQNAGEFEEALTNFLKESSGIPTVKELSAYVGSLYSVEKKMNLEELEKLTQIEPGGLVDRPVIPVKEPAQKAIKVNPPVEKARPAQPEKPARPVRHTRSDQEDKESVALFRISLGVLGVLLALVITGFMVMKVRSDTALAPKGTPSSETSSIAK